MRPCTLKMKSKGDGLRPAVLFMVRWFGCQHLAARVTVTLPLGLTGTTAASAVALKEPRKVAKYADLVASHNIGFSPAVFSTFGELGPEVFSAKALPFYCTKKQNSSEGFSSFGCDEAAGGPEAAGRCETL